MAGIDKTYCRKWEEYEEVTTWCLQHEFTCPNGMIVRPIWNVYRWNEEDFDGDRELPIMNTSQTVDYFLIKYCPIKLVQDRMREVYDDEYVESIKCGISEYDTFVRPESGTKVKMIKDSKYHNRKPFTYYNKKSKKVIWLMVEAYYNGEHLWYNEKYDYYLLPYELGEWGCSCADLIDVKSVKALIRRIKKWKLPKGTIVEVRGRYVGEDWKFKIV